MSNNFIFKNYFLYLTCIVICLFSYVRSSSIIPVPLTLKVTILKKIKLFCRQQQTDSKFHMEMQKMQNSQHNTGEEQYNWKINAT